MADRRFPPINREFLTPGQFQRIQAARRKSLAERDRAEREQAVGNIVPIPSIVKPRLTLGLDPIPERLARDVQKSATLRNLKVDPRKVVQAGGGFDPTRPVPVNLPGSKNIDDIAFDPHSPVGEQAPASAPTITDAMKDAVAARKVRELKPFNKEQAAWLALAQGGFALGASRRPDFLGAVSEAAGVGLGSFMAQQKAHREQRKEQALLELYEAQAEQARAVAKSKTAAGANATVKQKNFATVLNRNIKVRGMSPEEAEVDALERVFGGNTTDKVAQKAALEAEAAGLEGAMARQYIENVVANFNAVRSRGTSTTRGTKAKWNPATGFTPPK